MKKIRMFSIRQLLIAGVIVFGLGSCSKDEDPQPSKKSLLTAHVWVFSEAVADDEISTDFADLMSELLNETEVTFNENGNYSITGLVPSTGTWKLNSNSTKIIWNEGTNDEETQDIIKLTSADWWSPAEDETGTFSATIKYVVKQ